MNSWRKYLGKHGVGAGKTVAYKYYFDFVYGGYNQHPTVLGDGPAVPLFDTTKASKAKPASSAAAPATAATL